VKRIGVVDYLNALPLAAGLEGEPGITVVRDQPARIADALDAGELDVGLVPVAALPGHPDWGMVPDLGIASQGKVASVCLFLRRPLAEVRRVALDPASRTSNVLARLWLTHSLGHAPEFVSGPANLDQRVASADAAVGIGDVALAREHGPYDRIDLGQAWTEWTGLPFVFAVWAGPGAADQDLGAVLNARYETNIARLDQLVADAVPEEQRSRVLRYLRENICYRVGEAETRGLLAFFDRARAAGLLSTTSPVLPHARIA